jgi:hypothetical protein
MVSPVRAPSTVQRSTIGRVALVLLLAASLAGCGSTSKGSSTAQASASTGTSGSCPQTVLGALGKVVARAYHEGVSSERTVTARRLIAASAPLRLAVESGNAGAAQAAAQALVAGGHMTNLLVMRGATTLADVGGPALAPLRGTLTGAGGVAIGSYVTSVWSDTGFLAEAGGVAEGRVALRAGEHSVGGSFALPAGSLPTDGSLTQNQVLYQYTSFPAEIYPAGAARVYLLKPLSATAAFCGHSSEDTLVNTLSHVARLIYAGEAGKRTLPQVRRVQADQPLLRAVARQEPAATKLAVEGLLNQHIVRLRVTSGGRLLADVGGPYVLAPVSAPLRLGGRTIGSFVLSIQDDEGYLRLAKRLAGLHVLMYMSVNGAQPQLVKNSLGPAPGTVPASGAYHYRGRTFRVFTLHADAFPSGPLRIAVLIPIPYA